MTIEYRQLISMATSHFLFADKYANSRSFSSGKTS